ncbi:MAG: two-component hybrid sensor and regulator [Verrucomicrobiales bacterium]|nr:two-component hybrid sensor and regulator [Verrucomicrobiales bacterium]
MVNMLRMRPARRSHGPAATYIAALTSLLLCLGIRESLTFLGQDYVPFMFFSPAVLFSAWIGGLGPVWLTWALGLLLGDYLFTGPRYVIGPFGPQQIDQILAYSFNSFLGAYLILRLKAHGKSLEREVATRIQIQAQLVSTQTELRHQATSLEQTVQERTRDMQQTIEHLQGILYHLAHDLRAPLRTMSGFASLIKSRWAPREPLADLTWPDFIIEAAARLDTLISDLLEFGRLGYGNLPLTSVDPEKEVSAVLKDLAYQIEQSHASITVDSPLLTVLAHPRPLYLGLLNLTSNALKFARPGLPPEVHIWSESVGPQVKIHVDDKGIGFPPEQTTRIFKLFERLEDQSYQGHGMGLAIAEKAISRIGGVIGASSEPGKGSSFWLLLPKAQPRAPSSPSPPPRTQ